MAVLEQKASGNDFYTYATRVKTLVVPELEPTKEAKLYRQIVRDHGASKGVLESFNHWIEYIIPKQVAARPLKFPTGTISFVDVSVEKPTALIDDKHSMLTPKYARDNGLTYYGEVKATAVFTPNPPDPSAIVYQQRLAPSTHRMSFGKIPIMLGSKRCHLYGKTTKELIEMGECPNDPLAYYIIKGTEKTIVNQEQLRSSTNFTFVADNKGRIENRTTIATITGTTIVRIDIGKKLQALKVKLQHMKDNHHIPLFVLFAFLGVDKNAAVQKILKFVRPQNRRRVLFGLQTSIFKYDSVGDIVTYLASERKLGEKPYEELKQILITDIMRDLYANVPTANDKAEQLAMAAARMTESILSLRTLDDRDDWSNKRIVFPSGSAEQLFNRLLFKVIDNATKAIEADTTKTKYITSAQAGAGRMDSTLITSEFETAFGPNAWGVKGAYSKENITDTLKRETMAAIYSQVGRLNTPASRKATQMALRMIHPSQLGNCCLTGDTEVLHGDRIGVSKIAEMKNGDNVLTADITSLKETPSTIHSYFVKQPTKCLQITTLSDRTVKCDPEHPFAVLRHSGIVWVRADELKVDDLLLTKNYQRPVSREGQLYQVNAADIHPRYHDELDRLGLIGRAMTIDQAEILARLLGANMTDGCLTVIPTTERAFTACFCVGCSEDAQFIMADIVKLGFTQTKIRERNNVFTGYNGIEANHHTFFVQKGGAFAALMYAIGSPFGKKTEQVKRPIPEWIMNGPPSVKREFLSGFQGGDGGRIAMDIRGTKCSVFVGTTIQSIIPEYIDSMRAFHTQMIALYESFGITVTQGQKPTLCNGKIATYLDISSSIPNLYRYSEYIAYRYCREKEIASAQPIEFLRYKNLLFKRRLEMWDYIQHHRGQLMKGWAQIGRELGIKGDTVKVMFLKKRTEVSPFTRPEDLSYGEFKEKTSTYDDRVTVPITEIKQIAVEPVYDFTTASDNHNFYANGVLVKNCAAESPEGRGIGLIKNLAAHTYVSLERSSLDLDALLLTRELNALIANAYSDDFPCPFLINGVIRYWCKPQIVPLLVKARRAAKLPKDVCISYNIKDNFVEYYCDGARPTRPLLIVGDDGNLVIDTKNLWDAPEDVLIREGALEFVDTREQEYIILAEFPYDVRHRAKRKADLLAVQAQGPNPEAERELTQLAKRAKFTHSEIEPNAIFGIAGNTIPKANMMPGPRSTYQASMVKQALGAYHYNHEKRFDSSFKVLLSPQRPIFETLISESIGLNTAPTGTTPIVAFMAMPDNPEDAIVVKKEYLETRNMEIIKYVTHKATTKQSPEVEEIFGRPKTIKQGEPEGRYAAIDEFGLPRLGAYIRRGDCIIGKIRRVRKGTYRDENASLYAGIGEEGYVDRVLVSLNAKRQRVVKVKIRQRRQQIEGDKVASRYAQKGTFGRVIPAAELPRIVGGPNDGVVPDFFINPHSIPSRMTMGMIVEMLVSKAALYSGERVDGTTFHNLDVGHYQDILEREGMNRDGYETMIHPNGKPVQVPIFVGPCFYQCLRHHVLDKIQMRQRGAIKPLTHQPVSGRSNEGG